MESDATTYLTCSDASKLLPGRPSANCIWRWARRGVRSRGGERIRLEHVRMGGVLYTKACWIDDFGRALAEADSRHFDSLVSESPSPIGSAASETQERRSRELERVERELDEGGIR